MTRTMMTCSSHSASCKAVRPSIKFEWKAHFFSLPPLVFLFALVPQAYLHAENINHVQEHLSAIETQLTIIEPELQLASTIKLPETDKAIDPLLDGINPDDLTRAMAIAKRNFHKSWGIISKRSRYVRYRLLESLKKMQAPTSLQVIPIVESTYNPYALSYAGALGLWQLMPGTARDLGLHPNKEQDGRRNVEHSTQAAMQYLSILYDRFANWPLAIAAYNMGPNGLARRLRKSSWQNSDGLDKMPIPLPTRLYVQHVIGLTALLRRGDFTLPEPIETRSLALEPPVDITELAKIANMNKEDIFHFNPSLNQAQYLIKPLTIHVPVSKYNRLKEKVKLAGPKYIQMTVREGDSLWKISRTINTNVGNLRRLNPGVRSIISIGQKLKVPANQEAQATPNPNPLLTSNRHIRYKVRSGDSLWRIANRFGTTPKAIARSNQLTLKTLIRPGDTLWVLARL